jgi:hypothetical protein
METMTHDEKVKYLRIALNLQGISINDEMSDRVISTYDEVLKKVASLIFQML